jgi:hypothetical protein
MAATYLHDQEGKMKRSLEWKRVLIGCLLLALLTGCSTGAAETPAPEPAVTPTSKYAVAVAVVPTATPLPFVEGTEFPTGRFIDEHGNRAFEFDEGGNWHYFEGNMEVPDVSGKYATNGNLYTEMTHDYPERSIPVTYYWAYDGKRLTFQLHGEDLIAHRRTCYNGQTYFKTE